ncbi:xylulokinase [soil metagenome]
MSHVLGIDVSTTATKALLIDSHGQVIAAASRGYSYVVPQSLWSEQHPDLWWEAACKAIREVIEVSGIDPGGIDAVGLTGQMHGLVLLDGACEVLRPAILWNDGRTSRECDLIRDRIGRSRLLELTGNDALTGFTAPKILWVKENEPDVFSRARHVLLPKDFLRYKLTREMATDKAGAAGTLLFDLAQRDWSPEVLEALDIPRPWLPDTFEGPETTGVISAVAAAETGLAAGTPVVAGGGDQAAGAVGVGAVTEGVVSLVLGTSGVVFATSNEARTEPEGRLHAFCHAIPDRWHMMGVMLSAAGSLRWYRDAFAPEVSYDALLAEAVDVPPGSDGLIFLPYLTGERTPHPDPFARGAFVGLTVGHSRRHLTRAVLEGVAFGLRDSFDLMSNAGLPPATEVRISGGGFRNSLWRQIITDVLDTELVSVNTTEGAALGAALLAGVGTGFWSDVGAACDSCIRPSERTTPHEAAVTRYQEPHEQFQSLYPALKPTFHAMCGQPST